MAIDGPVDSPLMHLKMFINISSLESISYAFMTNCDSLKMVVRLTGNIGLIPNDIL